jgi:hypothetical protein
VLAPHLSQQIPSHDQPLSCGNAEIKSPAPTGSPEKHRHQGIAQRVPDDELDAPRVTVTDLDGERILRKPVLGGLINEYTHAA